jgi:hypothetical protein
MMTNTMVVTDVLDAVNKAGFVIPNAASCAWKAALNAPEVTPLTRLFLAVSAKALAIASAVAPSFGMEKARE